MSQSTITLRPSPAQERWLLLALRWPADGQALIVVTGIGGWRAVSLLTRCAFFLLGLIAAVMVCSIFGLAFREHFEIATGLALCVAGEWLIIRRRLNAAGVEEALIVAAYVLIVFGKITSDSQHDTAVTIGIAFALLLAGLRLLNPLFVALAAILISFAISFSLGFGLFHSSADATHVDLWTSLYCYVIAIIALLLGGRQYQRPSYDRMLNWLVVVMPVIAYVWSAMNVSYGYYLQDHSPMQRYVVLMPLVFAIAAFVIGIRRRTHAPLFAAMGCVACVAYELRNLTGMQLQWRLIMWGSLLLVVSTIVERVLRTPCHGVTSRKIDDRSNILDLVETVNIAVVTPVAKVDAPAPTMEGGGGGFSGGGASGEF